MPDNAESVAVNLADLLVLLQYMDRTVGLRDQEVIAAVDRLGDTVLKARMAQHNDGSSPTDPHTSASDHDD